jgi:hypothetical protein
MDTTYPYDYNAFISYRRSDGSAIANWLRRKLQNYVLAAELATGRKKLRLYLDTAFERANENFWTNNIEPALRSSQYLIVIATPDSMRPRSNGLQNWVEREIEFFRKLPQGRNVLVVRAKGKIDDELPARLLQDFPQISVVDMTSFTPLIDGFITRATLRDHVLTILGTLHGIDALQMPMLRMEDVRKARSAAIRLTMTALTLLVLISSLAIWALVQRSQLQQQLTLALAQRLLDQSRGAITARHDYDERAALYARQAYLLNRKINGSLEGEAYEAMRALLFDRMFVRRLTNPVYPGQEAKEGNEERLMIQNLAISPNGMWVAVYDNDDSNQPPYHDPYPERVVWWNLSDPKAGAQSLDPDVRPFLTTELEVANNGMAALTASSPCVVHIFDLKNGKSREPLSMGDTKCNTVAFSPSGNELAVSTTKGVQRISLDQTRAKRPVLASKELIWQLCYFPDGSKLVGVTNRTIFIWSLNGVSKPIELAKPYRLRSPPLRTSCGLRDGCKFLH